jgi:glucokinase
MATIQAENPLLTVVADIGGTHARFARLNPQGGLGPVTKLSTKAFAGLAAALDAFLEIAGGPRPARLSIAVAAPVFGDDVALTNAHWRFSIRDLAAQLQLAELKVANDYEALALALPHLSPADKLCIGPHRGVGRDGAPMAVLGPGTGLGMAGLIPVGSGWRPVTSECGYISLAPHTDMELAAHRILRAKYGRVSAERVLSGPGLVDLHFALAALDNRSPAENTPAAVIRAAQTDRNGAAAETVHMFCNLLGGLAGDVALLLLARGGVYLAGGILPRIIDILNESKFRERFELKGRGNPVVADTPTFLITHDFPTLLGCAAHLKR